MQDTQLLLRQGYATTNVNAYGVATAVASAGNATADGNTGFKQILNINSTPWRQMALVVAIPGPNSPANNAITTTGAPTALSLQLTITFSNDGSTTVGEAITPAPITWAVSANVGTPNSQGPYFVYLPRINHAYIKVAWAGTFTAGTTPTYNLGPMNIALEARADVPAMTDIS